MSSEAAACMHAAISTRARAQFLNILKYSNKLYRAHHISVKTITLQFFLYIE